MRGEASLPRRLSRMERQQTNRALEAEIARLAVEYGLHPDEVHYELEAYTRHRERYGPEPVEFTIRRLAAEFELDEAEVRAEYERITAQWGALPCPA
jgi:hypothetical protein